MAERAFIDELSGLFKLALMFDNLPLNTVCAVFSPNNPMAIRYKEKMKQFHAKLETSQ